jgi:hypothetical protein
MLCGNLGMHIYLLTKLNPPVLMWARLCQKRPITEYVGRVSSVYHEAYFVSTLLAKWLSSVLAGLSIQRGTCKTKPRRGAASVVTEFSIF